MVTVLFVFWSLSDLGISKLLLAACALSLASIVGSTSGLGAGFGREVVVSQARPAALRVWGFGWLEFRVALNPFFSERSVVLIGLL